MSPVPFESQLREPLQATIAWLQGEIRETPHHFAPPNTETIELIPTLIKANRWGLLTLNSQPAMDEPGRQQRATLSANTGRPQAEYLARHLAAAGLIADTWPLASIPPSRGLVCVSTWPGGRTWSLVPAGSNLQELPNSPLRVTVSDEPQAAESFRQAHLESWPDHRAALRRSWALEVVDPDWNTSNRLWTILGAAMDEQASPSGQASSRPGEEVQVTA